MSHARVLDANLNRAAEGLRTLEDLARFTLGDAAISDRAKLLRHRVRGLGRALGLDALQRSAARDAHADVGRETPSPTPRTSVADVATAAGARASEALRTIEEVGGLLSPEARADAGEVRYQVYELARAVTLALGAGSGQVWRLCVLITESACAGRDWRDVARAACEGGADMLQLREKGLPDRDLVARARKLVAIGREHRATTIINDRPDIALLAGADGVHVGEGDLSIADIRAIAGARLLIGATAATLERARDAAIAGADYLGIGPMYASTTKPKASLAGTALLGACVGEPQVARLPVLAISGIDADRARTLAELGCPGVAVCAAVCGAPDPASAAAEIRDAMGSSAASASITTLRP